MVRVAMVVTNACAPDPRVLRHAVWMQEAGYRVTVHAFDREENHAMSENHLLLRNLGVSSPELEALIQAAMPSSLGAKLTGAGGGGCMVALTRDPKQTSEAIELAGGRTLISRMGNEGVRIERG